MYKATFSISDSRLNFSYFVLFMALSVLLWRFYVLQVKQYRSFLERSEENRVRQVTIEPPRGLIYDRNGILLVENRPSYAVSVIPWEANKSPGVYDLLSNYLGSDKEFILSMVKKNSIGNFHPAKIKRSIKLSTLSVLEEHSVELPGVVYGLLPERFYPTTARMSHLLGYIREINDFDLLKHKNDGYNKGDLIGWVGLEKSYEQMLRGVKGFEYIQVDVRGRRIGKIETAETKTPKPGNDLHLSIDLNVQIEAERFLKNKKGAIILLDPNNGELIAFASAPDYSLDLLSGPISPEDWKTLQNESDHPMFNRATMSTYPPGSIYKLVTVIAALESGVIDRNWTINCPGYYKLGRRVFRCNRASGHGRLNLEEAVGQSCNVYFYNLMLELGLKNWSEYGKLFGFGLRTGMDIREESTGNVPNEAFLDKRYGAGILQKGHLLNLVLGQGDLLVTPIQMANFMMIIRNEGIYYKPHVARKYYYPGAQFYDHVEVAKLEIAVSISDTTWSVLKAGMKKVIEDDKGTGRIARIPGLDIYAKTGTAQNPHGDDHAWFVGYVEDELNPLVFVIIIENGGAGSTTAGPIGKALIMKYYQTLSSEFASIEWETGL
ncbi:MAG: penicillin-binding protein 2 [Candidatus Marinimicrobia bacterium]|nr:penicillin-binding protein 2 [Candidatus Neomarinimicrobiota bacterium]